MKRILLYNLLLPFAVQTLAQEQLGPLGMNAIQYQKSITQTASLGRNIETSLYYLQDTVTLPFIDDFYKDRTFDPSYQVALTNAYASGACCDLDTSLNLDTRYFMADTSWQYTYNAVDTTFDSTAKAPVFIYLFDDTSKCEQHTMVHIVWPTFYRLSWDTTLGIVDTTQVPETDTHIVSNVTQIIGPDVNSLWTDNDVFINDTYHIGAPTIGVATLDGLKGNGRPYNLVPLSYGLADHLTSKPIFLNGVLASDSVYLSFFYQPEGVGDLPNNKDSLQVQFLTDTGSWVTMASYPGLALQGFEQVLIPVINNVFLFDGFQFRFRNYATLSGNNDHWNIDYVKLDASRTSVDTILDDVAFRELPTSLLKDYQFIPYTHFDTSEFMSGNSMTMDNGYTVTKSVNYQYDITEVVTTTPVIAPPFLSTNILPESCTTRVFSLDGVAVPPFGVDSVNLQTTYTLDGGDVNEKAQNDTITRNQPLANYFAYDDGSAEKAYGLIGVGSKLAYRFTIKKQDTLRAIQYHWAWLNDDLSNEFYSVAVWNAKDGLPDAELATKIFQSPIYKNRMNEFVTYVLDVAVVLDPGDFFVGWIQTTGDILNLGFDMNHDASANLLYDVGTGWTPSQFAGAVMIRPILGKSLGLSASTINPVRGGVHLYPNPTNSVIHIRGLQNTSSKALVYNFLGALITQQELVKQSLDVSELNAGLYILRILDGDNIHVKKFVKTD